MPVLFTPSDAAARAAPAVSGVSAVAAGAAAAPMNNVRRVSAVISNAPNASNAWPLALLRPGCDHYATLFVPIFGWTQLAARIGLGRSKSFACRAGSKPIYSAQQNLGRTTCIV